MTKMGSKEMEVENMVALAEQDAGNLSNLSRFIAWRFVTIGEAEASLRLLGFPVGVKITVDASIENDSVVSLISHGIAY